QSGLKNIGSGRTRFNRAIFIHIISTVYLEVLMCFKCLSYCLINVCIRSLCQDMRFTSWIEQGTNVHSVCFLKGPPSMPSPVLLLQEEGTQGAGVPAEEGQGV